MDSGSAPLRGLSGMTRSVVKRLVGYCYAALSFMPPSVMRYQAMMAET
jgi:hypothetical protein